MVTKTATRPNPSSSHSQSHRTSSKANGASSPPPRVPTSAGLSLPPNPNPPPPLLRSPALQNEVRTPSPNYFGLIVDPSTDPRDSGAGPKNNWSPPSSSIRSFGAPSPKYLPLDSNPDFAAFRRKTEEGSAFDLGHGNLSHFAAAPRMQMRPRLDAIPTRPSYQDPSSLRGGGRAGIDDSDGMDIDSGEPSSYPSASKQAEASSRAPSEASLGAPSFFDLPRHESPAPMTQSNSRSGKSLATRLEDRHPRLSLPHNKADPPSPASKERQSGQHPRADTLPATLEDGPTMIPASQLSQILERLPPSQFLLLDLRVFPQFSQSRVQGALNLCIPTTLLKRPSFNLQKLQETFTTEAEKAAFSEWKNKKYIIVYDASSDEKKDALSSVNTLKKFSNEGWSGHSYIVRGGFAEFSKKFPRQIDNRSDQELQSSKINLSLGTSGPEVAPVAGGCLMPATKNAANPFFSNIRQNQDLIGGVGQMDVKLPDELAPDAYKIIPKWLLRAAEKDDHGKQVSDKFLRLEVDEQSRMTKALSSGVSYGTPASNFKDVQIAGIEKGGKNRYNNIWPFEHARVRLQGRPDGACDYVNASHIKASRSNKRYIASQGPLPATFEDFWSVVWDQDVRVIVMLTAESEGGQLKCHPYWSSKEYGPLKLKILSEKKVSLDTKKHRTPTERRDSGRRRANTTADNLPPPVTAAEPPHAIIRKLTLSHASHPFSPMREITQVHYSSWPDFGAPASPSQLLGLVELSNLMQRANLAPTESPRSEEPESEDNTRPMLVHCSAGCGRTGTFCTVDSVIDMLKRQRMEMRSGVTPMEITKPPITKDNFFAPAKDTDTNSVSGDWIFDQSIDLVEKTVEDFRGQRLSMVQSLRQYVLCYETVLEWVTQQAYGSSQKARQRSDSVAGF